MAQAGWTADAPATWTAMPPSDRRDLNPRLLRKSPIIYPLYQRGLEIALFEFPLKSFHAHALKTMKVFCLITEIMVGSLLDRM